MASVGYTGKLNGVETSEEKAKREREEKERKDRAEKQKDEDRKRFEARKAAVEKARQERLAAAGKIEPSKDGKTEKDDDDNGIPECVQAILAAGGFTRRLTWRQRWALRKVEKAAEKLRARVESALGLESCEGAFGRYAFDGIAHIEVACRLELMRKPQPKDGEKESEPAKEGKNGK